ncbi:DNA-binding response OmpR family regulator [Tumebacillus sp. BK434]|uniref:response regulator transcription factor n=1 Tax=Tumebacillus sp. BK434 TaxID=2512169 RepID=UPI00104CC1BC|nr:response regulator transcription factor [Tumebacillus sp. BK434]TCP52346.1 DNA-binding response OmpR family regulator [Tumebacillus sp. BK434]
MIKILITDDDPHIRELIKHYLQKEGFHTLEAQNGVEALALMEQELPELIVLDIMMPQMDGYEFCRTVKRQYDLPILMVTAKGESEQKIKGFQLGTDDYLVKPFDPLELVMRVKALLKRYRINASQTIRIGDVQIDRLTFEVIAADQRLSLPPKEFELLYKLAGYPGQIFTRAQLIEDIWGLDYEGDDRTVDVHVKRLRERLQPLTSDFKIATVRGLGYRLEVTL